jgi:hypothetical protein
VLYMNWMILMTDEDPCDSSQCQNGGSCRRLGYTQQYACDCASGYTDLHCSTSESTAGVWISFSRHSPNWRVVQYFHLPKKHKTTSQKYRKTQRGKKPSPGWLVGLYFYSAILNFTRIWRVGEWLSRTHGQSETNVGYMVVLSEIFRGQILVYWLLRATYVGNVLLNIYLVGANALSLIQH